MIILTDKGITAQVEDEQIILCDVLGNTLAIAKGNDVINTLHNNKLHPCFEIDSEMMPKDFHPAVSSVILDYNEHFTFSKWSESVLNTILITEWAVGQLAYGKNYDVDEGFFWTDFCGIEDSIRDGHIGPVDYDRHIEELNGKDHKLTQSLKLHREVSRLCELTRFEMAHAEVRLWNAIWLLQGLIREQAASLSSGRVIDIVVHGPKVDEVGWCITDAIKAMSTALDGLSKFIGIISCADNNSFPKVPSILANNLSQNIPNGKYVAADMRDTIQRLIANTNPLINMRHELTHNQTLYPIRQPAYVGYGTPSVNGLNTAYGEILWWDKNGDTYSRANGRIGFFTQQNAGIHEAVKSFINIYQLVDTIYDAALRKIIGCLDDLGIMEITVLDISHDTPKFRTCMLVQLLTALDRHEAL